MVLSTKPPILSLSLASNILTNQFSKTKNMNKLFTITTFLVMIIPFNIFQPFVTSTYVDPHPADSLLQHDTSIDVFLMEILPFKAKFILKNVEANCSKALSPLVDECYDLYEATMEKMFDIRDTNDGLRVGCCNLNIYHRCVLDAVERLAHYSIRACNELDAIAAEDVLDATELQQREHFLCKDYHQESFYCTGVIQSSTPVLLVLVLGVFALFICILLAGFVSLYYCYNRIVLTYSIYPYRYMFFLTITNNDKIKMRDAMMFRLYNVVEMQDM